MAGISSNALKGMNYPENRKKFQGQDFDKELELNWYQFKWRNHDPQIGRFIEIDPLASTYEYNSPYAFSENKVTGHVELEGLESVSINRDSNPLAYMAEGFGQMFQAAANALDGFTFGYKSKAEVPVSAASAGNVTVTVSSVTEVKTGYGFSFGDYMSYVKSHGSNDGNPTPLVGSKVTITTGMEQKTEVKSGNTTLSQKVGSANGNATVENGVKTTIDVRGVPVSAGASASISSNGDRKATIDVSAGTSTTQGKVSATVSQKASGTGVEVGVGVVQKTPRATVTSTGFIGYDWKKK